MKPVIIIAIVGVIVVIALGLITSISERTMSEFDVKPWLGLDCDEMLEFNGTEKYNMMQDSMRIEFHKHYMDNCSDIKPELISQECAGTARCITGSVTKIIDGDTIHVNGESVRFALSSAPELRGYGGVESRDFIDTVCPVGSDVIVDEDDGQTGESYGRIIGVIYCNGVNLNSELLDANLGYLEERFCDSSEFVNDSWAQKHGCMTTSVSDPDVLVQDTQNNCDQSYPDFCIPTNPPDLNCKDISQKRFTVLQPDPHRFDGDKDGIGCES